MNTTSDTPETDAHQAQEDMAHDWLWREFARKLERERNAAIKMAWELVQELAQKCDDPIHQRQLDQIRALHHSWTLPQNAQGEAQPPAKNL